MAYNSGNNPDALPAHAEPDQAAQILSSYHQPPPPQQQPQAAHQTGKYSNPPAAPLLSPRLFSNYPVLPYDNQSRPQYQNKPQPPLPSQGQPYQAPLPNRHSPHHAQNNASYRYNTSPPQNYGLGAPPLQPAQGRPPAPSRPPPTPAPTNNNVDASLFPLFKAVDQNGMGQLSEKELGKALVNGDFTSFDSHTVKMMIRMFDADKSGSINFDEFCGLWGFLAAWHALFERFDEDKSGYISLDEYSNALVSFGYRLSSTFVNMLYTIYDKGGAGRMSFDLFVQSCIILKRMTDVFKKYDEDRDGYITLSFEEFLTEVLRQR